MRALAVIGANYGDEGKGRTVDWLAAPLARDAVVVRSNGGAQAGHTVVQAGRRHVFHHFGSATLRGASTHCSRFMVSHPLLFAEERAALVRLGAAPRVTADPRGWVTTPWDMMVNQAVERARGGARHGSCGLGFGETVGRCEETAFGLAVADLSAADLPERLRAIRDNWLPQRLTELGLDSAGPLELAGSDALLARYLEQCRAFAALITLRDDASLGEEGIVIFEAAQGLLLDQKADGFPHVTRANTGVANMLAIAAEAGIDTIEAVYVTRCYLTRHGRGAMEDERPIGRWFKVEDATNQPNPWQETLRFGLLAPMRLGKRISDDCARGGAHVAVVPSLAVTCLDEARGQRLAWLDGSSVRTGAAEELLEALAAGTGLALAATFRSAGD